MVGFQFEYQPERQLLNNPEIVVNRINKSPRHYLLLFSLRTCCQLPNLPSKEFDSLPVSICRLDELVPGLERAKHTIFVSWVLNSLGDWL